ncbi:acyl carrier protein [Paenibacillus kobensis]|uniref:acyl carrier protein n=1 Tax=Paenibacillus kobensis TaxID=59841 RepID=UPI000FD71095|nr:acyl carrier protein [Paenibacillus kobensis]
MTNIEQAIMDCYKKVLEESGLNIEPSMDVTIGRDSGLDSLGLVNLMIEIEEMFDITLASVLVEIRQSHKLSELVPLIERAIKVCKP